MIVTKEEAKTKLCVLTGYEGDCIADKCMAWRWIIEERHMPGACIATIKEKGYCGLAGKPKVIKCGKSFSIGGSGDYAHISEIAERGV